MMTFSDAIPVQFWLIDCDTYNEEERYGQYNRCFCAPWECDDEIKIQFQDDTNLNFALLIYDDEDSLLDSIPIEETEAGVYLVAFTPSDNTPDFCEKKVQLQIRKEAGTQGITLPAFTEWANEPNPPDDIPWTLGANPSVSLTTTVFPTPSPVNERSQLLWVDYPFVSGVEYSLSVNYTYTGLILRGMTLLVMDNLFVSQFSNSELAGTGPNTNTLTFTANSDCTRIVVRIEGTIVEGTSTHTLNSISGTRSLGVAEIVAKSDCLNVKAEQEGTVLIQYSNYRNYAGIINNNGSPDLTFHLRIPAVFNEERFPETDEPLQLSNNRIISLNSQVKAQRLLETDQLPNYMRRKLMLVLKHQFITIEDKDYVKEEPLEEVENSNKHWPMRRMTCWLTEKEYVIRNIL